MDAAAIDEKLIGIEEIILAHGQRGIEQIRHAVSPGYCARAAEMILHHRGRIVIGTGFPVNGVCETDGPVGGIALYRVLKRLGNDPVFICAPSLSRILQKDYDTYEVPILPWEASRAPMQSAIDGLCPSLVIAVEHPGVAKDGRYYNMKGRDISHAVPKLDLFFGLCGCPTIAVGDGGNEIGMGNVLNHVSALSVVPSVTGCDELVIATVSNWGVYGVIAAMSRLLGNDLLMDLDPEGTMAYLVANGCVDGITNENEHSEDGFPLAVGLDIIEQLRRHL